MAAEHGKERLTLRRQLSLPPEKKPFLILVELVPLGGFNLKNIECFLSDYARQKSDLPQDFCLAAVTMPQNPRGMAILDPLDVFSLIDKKNLWHDLDIIPHLTAKDLGLEAIRSFIYGMEKFGLETVLVLTGDKPTRGKGVFDADSIGILELIADINLEAFRRQANQPLDSVHQIFPLAAVSPFKYTEASLRQQFFKMKKKIQAGAEAFIVQMGWDSRQSEEFFRQLKKESIASPVFGNVYHLNKKNPGLRALAEGKIPGCFVSPELYDEVKKEAPAQALERAAIQVAMYQDLGATGVDIGGLENFNELLIIVNRAKEISHNWRDHKIKVDFPPQSLADGKKPFYLNDDSSDLKPGTKLSPAACRATTQKRLFDFFHRNFMIPKQRLQPLVKMLLSSSRSIKKSQGAIYQFFFASEKWIKTLLFKCRECGDCFLTENFGYCTIGDCPKGLPNVPCGDSDPSGRCGNDLNRRCSGELIYQAALSEGEKGLERLASQILPPRNPALAGTSSIINYFFERDHQSKIKITQIGENLHASIPRMREAMEALISGESGSPERAGGAFSFISGMIKAQVRHGADYLDVNVDEIGQGDLELRKRAMRYFIGLIRKYGRGVPAGIDSGSPEVLIAGLESWYENAPPDLARPIINSVKLSTADLLLPLKKKYPFRFIGLLVDDQSAGREGVYGVDELCELARKLFSLATEKYGFAPDDIFFDSTVFPLVIDLPMSENFPGYTYRAFETIRRLKNDPALKGTHFSLGITNAIRDLPGRQIGVCRAYLARAIDYGLDAAIVNVLHDYGKTPPAPELINFVDAFIKQDGSREAARRAVDAMTRFCQQNRR